MTKTSKKVARIKVEDIGREAASVLELSRLIALHQAERDRRIAAINSSHEEIVSELETELAQKFRAIELCVETHKLIGGDVRSIETDTARIGIRLNPHSVTKRNPDDTWDDIVARLDEIEGYESYVNRKVSLNKNELLNHRTELHDDPAMKLAGICFSQSETFFIDPK